MVPKARALSFRYSQLGEAVEQGAEIGLSGVHILIDSPLAKTRGSHADPHNLCWAGL